MNSIFVSTGAVAAVPVFPIFSTRLHAAREGIGMIAEEPCPARGCRVGRDLLLVVGEVLVVTGVEQAVLVLLAVDGEHPFVFVQVQEGTYIVQGKVSYRIVSGQMSRSVLKLYNPYVDPPFPEILLLDERLVARHRMESHTPRQPRPVHGSANPARWS